MLKFCPEDDFIVCRYGFSYAGKGYGYGEPFDKTGVSIRKLRLLFDARHITPIEKQPEPVKENLTTDEKTDKKTDKFEIKQAGPAWVKAYKNGKQIGKAVRTREEAQAIIDEHS